MGLTHVKPRRWSVDEYLQMAAQGIFPAGEKTELFEGEIVSRVAAQNPPHIAGIFRGTEVFMRLLGDSHHVGVQVTVRLTGWTAPDPDFVLVPKAQWTPGEELTTGDLVVEVSDTTLAVDRHEKASLYALAGIQEYWIVNVADGQVEVHRGPCVSAEAPYGASYAGVTIHLPGSTVTPRCRPDVGIAVSDLLPPV